MILNIGSMFFPTTHLFLTLIPPPIESFTTHVLVVSFFTIPMLIRFIFNILSLITPIETIRIMLNRFSIRTEVTKSNLSSRSKASIYMVVSTVIISSIIMITVDITFIASFLFPIISFLIIHFIAFKTCKANK